MKTKTKAKLIGYSATFVIALSIIIWYYLQIPSPKWPTLIAWLFALIFFILWRRKCKFRPTINKTDGARKLKVKRYL